MRSTAFEWRDIDGFVTALHRRDMARDLKIERIASADVANPTFIVGRA